MSIKGKTMGKLVINVLFIQEYKEKQKIKSISRLADEIGISRSTLSKILRGDRNPGRKVITKMMIYFKVPFDVLFFLSKD